jgi:glycosyltransferase involved in cell wall biosynthesis
VTRRLLAVTQSARPGGAETTVLRLLRELERRGWSVALSAPGPGPLAAEAAARGWPFHRLAVGGLARRAGAPALASWPRARSLARRFDVIYLNGTVAGRLLPALRGTGVRTALSVHDVVERIPRMWRWADPILAASDAVARSLAPLPATVVFAPVDLDPPAIAPPWPMLDGAGPVVGFVGRIERRKAPLDLVRAAPRIRAAVPGARVVLVGDDPYGSDPAYVAEVERAAAAAGVERCGWVDNAPGAMRHLDVLVLPSRREPFGTVLAEAMAVGTPVVATRVDGLPEVVEDGVTGALVAPGDPDALAAAVVRVLARRDELGATARERARRFASDAYADRVEPLLAPDAARRETVAA